MNTQTEEKTELKQRFVSRFIEKFSKKADFCSGMTNSTKFSFHKLSLRQGYIRAFFEYFENEITEENFEKLTEDMSTYFLLAYSAASDGVKEKNVYGGGFHIQNCLEEAIDSEYFTKHLSEELVDRKNPLKTFVTASLYILYKGFNKKKDRFGVPKLYSISRGRAELFDCHDRLDEKRVTRKGMTTRVLIKQKV